MQIFHGYDLLQYEVLEQNGSHFKVIDGDSPRSNSIDDLLGPLEPSYNWMEVLQARKPNAARAELASITVAQVCRLARDKLFAVHWVVTQQLDEDL